MESIGRLLQRGQGDDQEARAAAFVVATANKAIQAVARILPGDAQAVSVQRDTVTIRVSHGSVAGKLQRLSPDICDHINTNLRGAASGAEPVRRLVTRPQ